MGKVYVANLGGHDMTDAARYGKLVFLTSGSYSPNELDRIFFELTDKLRHFDPEQDYFLPVGQDVVHNTAMYILTVMYGTFRVLYWNFRYKKYIVQQYSPNNLQIALRNLELRKELEKNDRYFIEAGADKVAN